MMENERKIRSTALERASRSAVPGENMIETIRRAHYYAHWLEDGSGGKNGIVCPATCVYKEPVFPTGISINK
jgi:hypothetical protein